MHILLLICLRLSYPFSDFFIVGCVKVIKGKIIPLWCFRAIEFKRTFVVLRQIEGSRICRFFFCAFFSKAVSDINRLSAIIKSFDEVFIIVCMVNIETFSALTLMSEKLVFVFVFVCLLLGLLGAASLADLGIGDDGYQQQGEGYGQNVFDAAHFDWMFHFVFLKVTYWMLCLVSNA